MVTWRARRRVEWTMKTWLCVLATAAALAVAAHADRALTNEDIVKLTKGGLGPSPIIAKIRSAETAFDTSVNALLQLAEQGVDDGVLAAMVIPRSGPAPVTAAPTDSGSADAASAPSPTAAFEGVQPKAIPGSTFQERLRTRGEGPLMVVIPAGTFRMGCVYNDDECDRDEKPVHDITIAQPFAVSVYEVTFEDYDLFSYPNKVGDQGWGRGSRPVINVSWHDAKEYVAWLSTQTGGQYRLLTEAEWEYAARAGSRTKFSWGSVVYVNRANCRNACGDQWEHTAPVGSFPPNGFGLYDMPGNVWEMVEDCWNPSYTGAPADGSAWLDGNCDLRVGRGGSWYGGTENLRPSARTRGSADKQGMSTGFRVARTLAP